MKAVKDIDSEKDEYFENSKDQEDQAMIMLLKSFKSNSGENSLSVQNFKFHKDSIAENSISSEKVISKVPNYQYIIDPSTSSHYANENNSPKEQTKTNEKGDHTEEDSKEVQDNLEVQSSNLEENKIEESNYNDIEEVKQITDEESNNSNSNYNESKSEMEEELMQKIKTALEESNKSVLELISDKLMQDGDRKSVV